ncbi:MAG TPA: hypothetical protein VI357_23860 [Mycobacteriales bacterium]
MTEVRELLESAAGAVPEDTDVPLAAVLAAGRRRVRRRRLAVAGTGAATAAALLLAGLPLDRAPGGGPGPVDAVRAARGGGSGPVGTGDTTCGDVRFDKAELPGRRVTADNGDWPTAQAADLLALHGWPRAVPYDAARWTVVVNGNAGVLVASLPGAKPRYLSIHRGPNNSWIAGVPCTPH